MKIEFNYKNPCFYLLSLFGAILILCLLDQIKLKIVLVYSIVGIITCLIVWGIGIYYDYQAEKIQNGTHEEYYDNSGITEIRSEMITVQVVVIIFSVLVFVIIAFYSITV